MVWIGAACGVLVSLGLGLSLDLLSTDFPQREQELFEAVVGLVTAAMLTTTAFWMRRAGRSMRRSLEG